MKESWRVIRHPYSGDRDSVEALARMLVCLTNLKLRTKSLYANEKPYEPFPEVEEEYEEPDETSNGCGILHDTSNSTCIGGGHRALDMKAKTSENRHSSQRSKELHKNCGKCLIIREKLIQINCCAGFPLILN